MTNEIRNDTNKTCMAIGVQNAKTQTVRLRGGLTEPEKNTTSGKTIG